MGRRLERLATLARVLLTGWFEPRLGGGSTRGCMACGCEISDDSAMKGEKER